VRVLHILGELRPSGAEQMLCSAAASFAKQGVSADVLSTGVQVGTHAHRFEESGYTVHHLPFRRHPLFFLSLWRLIRRGGYDVIHLHTERANFWQGLTVWIAGVKENLRTVHSNFTFEGRLRRRRGWQRRMLARMGIKHVAISPTVQHNERTRFGLETILISNWYDSNRFKPPTSEQRKQSRIALNVSNDCVLITVGNCSVVKNHTALMYAMAALPAEQRPIWLHVGEEVKDCTERQLAKKLEIDKQVRFLGPQADVLPFLHAADLFAMPSLYEGFGVSAIEAIACGLPCLFTDVTGLCDFKGQFLGLFYCQPDAASLSDSLLKYLDKDANYWQKVTRENHKVAQRLYSIERGVSAYVHLYEASLIGSAFKR